jgi:hypothetical protein
MSELLEEGKKSPYPSVSLMYLRILNVVIKSRSSDS